MRGIGQQLAWILPLGLLLLAIVSVPVRILAADGLPRYRALAAKQEEIRRENERLRREVRALRRRVATLRSDPAAVERIARDELGMIREGELVFQFAE